MNDTYGKGEPMTLEIRPAGDDDFFGWLPLFATYCEFHDTAFDDAKALSIWNWLRDEHHPLRVVLAVDEADRPVGFAHFREEPRTLCAATGIHLDDLYVDESSRGTGIGRALVEHVRTVAASHGHGSVRGTIAANNDVAQKLCESLATRTSRITYELEF